LSDMASMGGCIGNTNHAPNLAFAGGR
jgi:hypothetical protein